jgi:radical SAM superfamily enzyme YgiQ (UPF0313 family)
LKFKISFIKIFCDWDKRKYSHSITFDFLRKSIEDSNISDKVETKVCFTLKEIREYKPNLVVVCTATESFMATKRFIKELKSRYICTVLVGGTHITALPETLPENCYGFIGEGENGIVEIIDTFLTMSGDIRKVKGVVYRDYYNDGKLVINETDKLQDMDSLPIPEPAIVPYDMGKGIMVVTSRGCVNKCIHCSETGIWKEYRELSADKLAYILEKYYIETGIKDYIFLDDLSISNKERLIKLRDILSKKNLIGKINIRKVSCNAELMDEDIIKILKELGIKLIGFGLESGSPNVLKRIKCNKLRIEDVENLVRISDKYNIRTGGSGVWGFIGETLEDMYISKKFILDLNRNTGFKSFEQYICQPLPGSILWGICLKKNVVSLDMDFETIQTQPRDLDDDSWLYINGDSVERKVFVEFMKNMNKELIEVKSK